MGGRGVIVLGEVISLNGALARFCLLLRFVLGDVVRRVMLYW